MNKKQAKIITPESFCQIGIVVKSIDVLATDMCPCIRETRAMFGNLHCFPVKDSVEQFSP